MYNYTEIRSKNVLLRILRTPLISILAGITAVDLETQGGVYVLTLIVLFPHLLLAGLIVAMSVNALLSIPRNQGSAGGY